MVRRVARGVHGAQGELGALDGVAVAEVAIAHQTVAVGERQDLGAGALLEPAAPGEWSGWVWVQRIQRIRPLPAAATASR